MPQRGGLKKGVNVKIYVDYALFEYRKSNDHNERFRPLTDNVFMIISLNTTCLMRNRLADSPRKVCQEPSWTIY